MDTQTLVYQSDSGWNNDFNIPDSNQTLIIIFASRNYENSDIILDIKNKYANSIIIGCSTAGEILGDTIYDNSIVVAITKFNSSTIKLVEYSIDTTENSFTAGDNLSKQLVGDNLKLVFTLSDGLNVNGSDLVKGLKNNLKDTVITGGLAGDGKDFADTWVISNGNFKKKTIVAVGVYGDKLDIASGFKGGWEAFGPVRDITKSKNNVLYELDNQPALDLYKDYLGELASGLPATGLRFPLKINEDGSDEYIVRTILAVDEEEKTMTFAGDMPEGFKAQLMNANFEQLVGGAEGAAQIAKNSINNPNLVIAVSCVGRRMVLGEEAEAEVEAVADVFDNLPLQIGFHSYGEISSKGVEKCDLHNQTMTLTIINEK